MKFRQLSTALIIILLVYSCAVPDKKSTSTQNSGVAENQSYIEYYENGAKKSEGLLVKGKKQGKWTSYYPNGYKWSETTYYNDIKQGSSITYFKNGMLRYQGEYSNDKRSGIWYFYNEEGELLKKVDTSL